jgi:hypothetical protein
VRPEGHFLGDPLQRIVRHPVSELKDKVGPLAKAVTSTTGAGVTDRAASLAGITGMLGRAAVMRGRDPVRRLRARLRVDAGGLEAAEREVEAAVRKAVEAALASLEEVPA